jgi:N-methylhydantoinase A
LVAFATAAAVAAIADKVALPLKISVDDAAEGIIRVINAAMVRGIRRVTVERGLDPREFAVFAFGGAGPLHAVDLAAELSIRTIIIPPTPGLLCAAGLLLSPWRHDDTVLVGAMSDQVSAETFASHCAALEERVRARAVADGIDPRRVTTAATLEMRYWGQGHQLVVKLEHGGIAAAVEAFHQSHRRNFGYDRRSHPVEIVTLRLSGSTPPTITRLPVTANAWGAEPVVGRTEIRIGGRTVAVPVLDRARLAPGKRMVGPMLIEQSDTTILVGPQAVEADALGNLLIRMDT